MLASHAHSGSLKREGLGLGGVDMPAELGGSTRDDHLAPAEPRSRASKTPRTRHLPSHSSPPSLAPFTANLKASAAPAPAAPTSRMSVLGAAPPTMSSAASTSSSSKRPLAKQLSSGLISYPMVARIDSTPTFTPAPEVPPIPTSLPTKVAPPAAAISKVEAKKAVKARPPPVKVSSNQSGSSFLSPLKSRFSRGGKDKDLALVQDEDDEDGRSRSRTRRSKVDTLIAENQAAIKAAFPDVVSPAAAPAAAEPSPEVDLSITMPRRNSAWDSRTTDILLERARAADEAATTGIVLGSPIHDLSSSAPVQSSMPPPRPSHRRGTSDESPQIVQEAFARIADLYDDVSRPSTLYSSRTSTATTTNSRRPSAVSAATSSALKARERPQSVQAPSKPPLATVAKVDDAFFPPAVGLSTAPSVTPSMSRRPSSVPRTPLSTSNSIGISVREGAAPAPREVARAALGADGLTVSLRSYHRPEELEVGWVCLPRIDDEGRPYTSWEIRLKPRASGAAPAVPPLQASTSSLPEPLRSRTPSTSAATFLNYRMNASSTPASSNATDLSGMYPPTSAPPSAPSSRRPSQLHSPTTPTSAAPPRKLSGRSEASSYGGSFSSDSSYATTLSGGRRPKLSVSSIATTMTEGLPPFDLEAIRRSCYFEQADVLLSGGGPPRTNRSSSYAPGAEGFPRARQFSIDEEGIMGRAASFSVGHGVAHRPKSLRQHKFGAHVPPVSQSGGTEFAQLAQQVKRKSSSAHEGAIEGHEVDITMGPTTPSPDRRLRKPSLASADGLPPPPPMPALPQLGDDGGVPMSAKSFLAGARAGRRKQSIAPPAALVLQQPTSDGGSSVLSPSLAKATAPPTLRSPLGGGPRRASDVFGPSGDLRTPTKARGARTPTRPHASTPPPSLPLPSLPGSGPESPAAESEEDDHRRSVASSAGSSFVGGRADTDVDDDSEVDPEVEDVQNASIRMAQAHKPPGALGRQMSHWSETDDDDELDESVGGSECQTSWCKVPDAAMTSEEEGEA
ncbi:hypothetical protein JCM9279_003427 [Rhodotorula babjevae]